MPEQILLSLKRRVLHRPHYAVGHSWQNEYWITVFTLRFKRESDVFSVS